MLRRLSDRLHVHEEPLRFFGVEIGRICTVVQLSGGGLLVHSPARLTPEFERALRDLGDVRFVVPASKLHGHLHMEAYREAYPASNCSPRPGSPRADPTSRSTGCWEAPPTPAGAPTSTRPR